MIASIRLTLGGVSITGHASFESGELTADRLSVKGIPFELGFQGCLLDSVSVKQLLEISQLGRGELEALSRRTSHLGPCDIAEIYEVMKDGEAA